MIIPFLFELRTVLDWIFVKTSLTFFEWVRVESIYAQVYTIKSRRIRVHNENPRGKSLSNWKKLLVGGGITALLIAVIWFPLILFAYSTSYGKPNIPQVVVVNFQFGTYDPIYKAELMHTNIHQFTQTDWNTLMSIYARNPTAKAFLEDFEPEDVVAIHLVSDSSTMWSVSPPNAKQMIKDIKNGKLKSCRFEYRISRNSVLIAGLEEIKGEVEYKLNDDVRKNLVAMLSNSSEAKPVLIPSIFPKLLLAKNTGLFEPISDLMPWGENLFLKKRNEVINFNNF